MVLFISAFLASRRRNVVHEPQTLMREITPRGFVRPVTYYRLNGLHGSAAVEALTRVGRHVAVNIPDRRHIREAIEELRRIEDDLARHLPAE